MTTPNTSSGVPIRFPDIKAFLLTLGTYPDEVVAAAALAAVDALQSLARELGEVKKASRSQPCGEASADAEVFAGLDAEPSAAWRPIDSVRDCRPVLVSRPVTSREYVEATAAFIDATGAWKVFRSEGGMSPLPFEPTHWMPLPKPPAAAREQSEHSSQLGTEPKAKYREDQND